MIGNRFRHRRRGPQESELNLVPLIDIFTVLVFFLLVTAVFSRITILGLSLPAKSSAAAPPDHLPHIEIVVRSGSIEAGDREQGRMQTLTNSNEDYDLTGLSELLLQLKASYPQHRAATVLLEPDIAYDQLVRVMDTVRVLHMPAGTATAQAELFPDISIGDAPAASVAALGQRN